MAQANFVATLQSTEHEFIAALRHIEDYARNLQQQHTGGTVSLGHVVPRFDLEEHERTYEIYGELPGFQHENIVIEANDHHSVHVSGWISRKTSHQPELQHSSDDNGEPSTLASAQDSADPYVKVQHHEVPTKAREHHTDRFGDMLNTHREPPREEPLPAGLPGANSSELPQKPTEEDVPTARFGDTLDPHQIFVHRGSGAGSQSTSQPRVRLLIAERQFGQFHRTFQFPSPIKHEEVTARHENGVLQITVPKAHLRASRKVEINRQ